MKIETRRGIVGLAIASLILSYVFTGWVALAYAIGYSQDLIDTAGSSWERLMWIWFFFTTILTTIQLLAIPFFLAKEHCLFQNPLIKGFVLLSQLSWGFLGYRFPPWYVWVASSAILFFLTPDRRILEDS